MSFTSPLIHSFAIPVLSGLGVLATLVCTFFIVWGGLAYITSSGNPNKLARSKHMLFRAVIGLVIVLSASAISLILTHTYSSSVPSAAQKLPTLGSIKPTAASGGLVGVLIKAIAGVMADIVETVGKPFIAALSYFTKSTPLLTHSSSVMHLWAVCAGIADALMALVIALIGFHVMSGEYLGLRDISLSMIVPQLILSFILINTSIYLLDGAIELSNVMINAVRSGIGASSTPWQALLAVVAGASRYSLAALIIFVIFLVFSVILLIYYIGRIVTLYLGAVLAPLLILLWLIPSFRDFTENAFKAYLSTVFVLFIHVVILSLAGSLFLGVANSGSGSTSPDPIMSLLLGLATLIALIKTQGVLMQLNYASIGPRTARRIGTNFINGVSYLALNAKMYYSSTVAPALSNAGVAAANLAPQARNKIAQTGPKAKNEKGPKT